MKYFSALLISTFIFISCSNNNQKSTFKETDDPIEFLTQEIKKEPENFKFYGQRATVFLEQGKIDPAFRDINKAIKLNPDDAGLYIVLSDIYFVLGNKENSISSLKKANSLDPGNAIPLLKLSELFLLTKEYDKTHFFADKAIDINIDIAEPYYYKGIAFLESGDTSSALANLRIASNIDTSNFAANMQIGVIYYESNDSISEIYLKKALNNQPENASALYYLGMLYQESMKFEKALDTYAILMNNTNSNKRAYYNSAYIYLIEYQDYDRAVEMFEAAINVDPNFVEAVYNLGRTYEEKGDLVMARKYYQKAIDILPNYPLAVQALNRID
jgi:superkiller protein 3